MAPPRHLVWLAAFGVATFVHTDANAGRARGLKATQAPSNMTIDGEPKEWDTDWRDLDHVLRGDKPDQDDVSGRVTIAYDDTGIYVAAEITDDKLVGGSDHVELLLGIPGGTAHSITFYPGVPGKSKASVKSGGRTVSDAEIVEAPSKEGYSLEARVPWSAIPRSGTVRVGYRGAIFVHDGDGRSADAVIGTADTRRYAELPPISTEPELALGGGLLRERNITQAPRYNRLANVVGDQMLERILVYDRYLVVLGPGYRGGEQYYFRDLAANSDRGRVLDLELADYTGDGRPDMKVRKLVKDGGASTEVLEILSYHGGADTPEPVFAQDVKLSLSQGSIENEVKLTGSGSRTRIVLSAGKMRGIDPSRFSHESTTGAQPVLAPWGNVAQQTFGIENGSFSVVDEKKQAAMASSGLPPAPPPLEATSEPAPRATAPRPTRRSSSEPKGADVERVYGLYKEQRSVRGAPRFDVRADLAEDGRSERLVVHGRDLVVFGEGYRGGRGFAAVTLAQFDKSGDIRSVTTRDVTGDGKHEIVIRGIINSPLPSDIGDGDMERTVVMVYQLKGGHFDRVFAAEVGRRIGKKKVVAKIQFGNDRIDLTPGNAVGYDEQSYPWAQKKSAEDGFEPLLLPWGGVDRVRLRWNGEQFVR
jgi:hypothetical protein